MFLLLLFLGTYSVASTTCTENIANIDGPKALFKTFLVQSQSIQLSCPAGGKLAVRKAYYYKTNGCPQGVQMTTQLQDQCNDQPDCSIGAEDDDMTMTSFFANAIKSPQGTGNPTIDVSYQCVYKYFTKCAKNKDVSIKSAYVAVSSEDEQITLNECKAGKIPNVRFAWYGSEKKRDKCRNGKDVTKKMRSFCKGVAAQPCSIDSTVTSFVSLFGDPSPLLEKELVVFYKCQAP